jgi:hypothetical protein
MSENPRSLSPLVEPYRLPCPLLGFLLIHHSRRR